MRLFPHNIRGDNANDSTKWKDGKEVTGEDYGSDSTKREDGKGVHSEDYGSDFPKRADGPQRELRQRFHEAGGWQAEGGVREGISEDYKEEDEKAVKEEENEEQLLKALRVMLDRPRELAALP